MQISNYLENDSSGSSCVERPRHKPARAKRVVTVWDVHGIAPSIQVFPVFRAVSK